MARKVQFKVAGCKYCVNRVCFQYWRCSLLASRRCKIQNNSGAEPFPPQPNPPANALDHYKTQSLTKKLPYNISLEKKLYMYICVCVCICMYMYLYSMYVYIARQANIFQDISQFIEIIVLVSICITTTMHILHICIKVTTFKCIKPLVYMN